MIIHVLIPIKDELTNLYEFSTEYRHEWFSIRKNIDDIRITFIDDSSDYTMRLGKSLFVGEKYNHRFLKGCGNYGDSIIKGLLRAGEYDKIIVMDIDHPVSLLYNMITLLDKHDVVIGNDTNKSYSRDVTKWLCNNILGLNLNHPTCGFIGFNSYCTRLVDDRNIKMWRAISKRDIVHVEWMKEARNRKLNIGELDFYSDAEHNYSICRCIRWLYDFTITVIRNTIHLYP